MDAITDNLRPTVFMLRCFVFHAYPTTFILRSTSLEGGGGEHQANRIQRRSGQASSRAGGPGAAKRAPGSRGEWSREGAQGSREGGRGKATPQILQPLFASACVFFFIEPPLFAFTTLGGSSSSLPPWEGVAPPHPILSRT